MRRRGALDISGGVLAIGTAAVLFAFVLAGGATTAMKAASEQPRNNSQSTTTVMFGDVAYHVPNDYLLSYTPFQTHSREALVGSGYASFTIGLLLPDFRPAKSNWAEFQRTGWHNQLRASFEYGRQYRKRSDFIAQLLSWGKIKVSDYTKSANGCRVYRGNMTVTQELRVCKGKFGILMIECHTIKNLPFPTFPYCQTSENISDDTTLAYAYSRTFVDDAINIDNRMRATFRSFASAPTDVNP